MALHRAGDVADDDERARLMDRPPPDPVEQLAAGPEVAPEHGPRRQAAAVRMQLVAARAAALEAWLEQVDQPFGFAQLRWRHAVEVTMAKDLALAVRIRGDDDALDRRLVVGRLLGQRRDRDPALVGLAGAPFLPGERQALLGSALDLVAPSVGSAGGWNSPACRRRRWRHQRSKTAS